MSAPTTRHAAVAILATTAADWARAHALVPLPAGLRQGGANPAIRHSPRPRHRANAISQVKA